MSCSRPRGIRARGCRSSGCRAYGRCTVELTVRIGRPVPLEPGLGFAIREGGRTVGAGTVLTVG
ncbi:hypothetical protein F5X71_29350 [Nocardia brasiliensis]|uniref:Translation elongation factor EFTu/EF1A C-terminal domain-containing protein n=1 Tax=Nocardia brasiliensis TaxID=37326 RepID=A0A6G9XY91_NOCBR|nr:hypothetical protein F5X71_29350 [Nocardia brasiliensis]